MILYHLFGEGHISSSHLITGPASGLRERSFLRRHRMTEQIDMELDIYTYNCIINNQMSPAGNWLQSISQIQSPCLTRKQMRLASQSAVAISKPTIMKDIDAAKCSFKGTVSWKFQHTQDFDEFLKEWKYTRVDGQSAEKVTAKVCCSTHWLNSVHVL